MTNKYKNVYLDTSGTIVGPYEQKGLLKNKFDRHFDDLYCKQKSFEQAESFLMNESIDILLKKKKLKTSDIDLFIAGDLQNQITASCYCAAKLNLPFLGIYAACASNALGMIIAANYLESKEKQNCLLAVSSHNMVSEKQFRNPTEYGAPKPSSATFTATGGASIIITNNKTNIRIESATIGKVMDMDQNDPNNMGACMASSAIDTIYQHLKDLKRDASYYDLIVTGDLGKYGKEIVLDYMKKEYKIDLSKRYNDCGTMLYNLEEQKEVQAGGSGPVCSALVLYADILPNMRNKKLKRVLYVPTGALFNPTMVFQKQNILSIAHAISLEVVD